MPRTSGVNCAPSEKEAQEEEKKEKEELHNEHGFFGEIGKAIDDLFS